MGRARRGRLAASALTAVLAVSALTGCTLTSLQQQYQDGDNKGYIAGSGVTEIKAADRGDPVRFTGTLEDGSSFDSRDDLGDVLVVNFWYDPCGPCIVETKDLESISKKYADQGVDFVGVNTRNDAATVQSFDKKYGVTYPSILDADDGKAQLAFSGQYRPNATPTTIVLDKKGRVAARIEGPINSQPSTLETLIESALEEGD
ncbi:TlpA family protein disulfide reductase [Gryllotalpicola ginsengisoli]|uniref:TlpA family protein disulfide reductase n=1 Tax=Gryllotalpicola ginsengisoli TaxID=444608 RepID=UPI000413B8B9|nr:TlpA disulfide reductase family protein [Gryllotalpicola ginsengisoli]